MSDFNPELSFGIVSTRGFLTKLKAEYDYFNKDAISPIHAINCALTSWHLCDWTYNEFIGSSPLQLIKCTESLKLMGINLEGLGTFEEFRQKLKLACPELQYMQWIANGSKHCILRNAHKTGKTVKYEGDFAFQDFSRHDFDVDRFEIEELDGRKVDFEKSLLTTIGFWEKILNIFDPL